jgi:8-hydroxy-5-deazaflavin:NADPH oxidoreductase
LLLVAVPPASSRDRVMIGSRDPGKSELREWLSSDGAGIEAGTFAQPAVYGELLVLAVLGTATEEAITEAGRGNFSGKVVIDPTNPLDFSGGFPPKLAISGEDSLGERVQRTLPDPKVVKAFNTIGNEYYVDPSFSEGKPTMLIAGDDEAAKRTVGDVLADFGRPEPVDIGGIEGARELEAICIAWVKIGGARGLLGPRLQAPDRLDRMEPRRVWAISAARPKPQGRVGSG